MFVFRVHKRQAINILWTAAIAAVIAAAVVSLAFFRMTGATQESVGNISLSAENGCAEFLKQLNLTADAAKTEKKKITVPSEFNEVYAAYNELQAAAGLDLTPYRGREAELLSVPLKNSEEAYAVLLVHGGRVIGGHLTSGKYGDEIKPLPIIKEENGTTG